MKGGCSDLFVRMGCGSSASKSAAYEVKCANGQTISALQEKGTSTIPRNDVQEANTFTFAYIENEFHLLIMFVLGISTTKMSEFVLRSCRTRD